MPKYMTPPNVDPNFADKTARSLIEDFRVHQEILGTVPLPPWESLPEVWRQAMRRAVSDTIEKLREKGEIK